MKRRSSSSSPWRLRAGLGFWLLTSPGAAARRARAGAGRRARPRERPGDFLRGRLHLLPSEPEPGRPHPARRRLAAASPFGTFYRAEHLAASAGRHRLLDAAQFQRAMRGGVSPDGRHYYPAFPYTSYQRMTAKDLRDLFAYLKTLPPVPGPRARPRPAVPLHRPARARAVEARLPRRQAFSRQIPRSARAGTAAPISSKAPRIAPNATAPRNAPAPSRPSAASPAAPIPRARARSRTSRRTKPASAIGRRATSPRCCRPA